jgi:Bromodomain
MKLSEQKKMYTERIRVIWKRQLAALAAGSERGEGAGGDSDDIENEVPVGLENAQKKSDSVEKDDSDDSDDDDDFAAALEDEMVDRSEANQLVAAHARTGEEGTGLGNLRAATQDQDLTKDARELAALKRQREEERVAKQGLKAMKPTNNEIAAAAFPSDRKVIRKKIIKVQPDGQTTTKFKFILHPDEVGKIMARLAQDPNHGRPQNIEYKYEQSADEKPPGHAMFEDEDDFEYSSSGRLHGGRRRGGGRRRTGGRGTPRPRIGKLKTRTSNEERMRKRKKEEEELEVYSTAAKRKGTSNRRERGSIRDRRAHVIFAERLEAIRQEIESRPSAGPFLKPVNRKLIPRYYEVISHPIDVSKRSVGTPSLKFYYLALTIALACYFSLRQSEEKLQSKLSLYGCSESSVLCCLICGPPHRFLLTRRYQFSISDSRRICSRF